MTSLNNTVNIPLSARPKLYTQMIQQPYDLPKLSPNQLFNYLQAEKKYGHMTLKNYSEFLNIFNTLIFFYNLALYNIKREHIDLVIFFGLDVTFMLTAFLYYFLMKNKQNIQNTRIILIFSMIGIGLSKLINGLSEPIVQRDYNLKRNIRLHYHLFSVAFLVCYDYYTNPLYSSSSITKLLYLILAFIPSNYTEATDMKLKIFIYAINFFEFIPEIRKCINNYTNKHNAICYTFTLGLFEFYLMYMGNYLVAGQMLIINLLVIEIYPTIFDYFYNKQKMLIKGLWDLPQVTSYY